MPNTRWRIEVRPLGENEKSESVFFDADSWHHALLLVRRSRQEQDDLGGFSIELLPEGYRAIDPLTRVVYFVKSASETTDALSPALIPHAIPSTPASSTKLGGTRQGPPRPGAGASSPAVTAVAAPAPAVVAAVVAAAPVSAVSSPKPMTNVVVPTTERLPYVPPSPSSTTAVSSAARTPDLTPLMQTEVAKAGGALWQAGLANRPGAANPNAFAQIPAVAISVQTTPNTVTSRAPLAKHAASQAAAKARLAKISPESIVLLSQRVQDASSSAPLTYREFAFALPMGTDEELAETFARAKLEEVRVALSSASRRFVTIAVFDEIFTGRPTVAPLVVLEWKDWKGDPHCQYPRTAPMKRLSEVPPRNSLSPQLDPLLPPLPPNTPVLAALPHELFLGPATAPPVRTHDEADNVKGTVAAVSISHAIDPFAPGHLAGESPAGGPRGVSVFPSLLKPASAGGVGGAAAKAERDAPTGLLLSGDELIGALFEDMHELHFQTDAIDAAYFCLHIAHIRLGVTRGMVHFFDLDKRQFVLAAAMGHNPTALLLTRLPTSEALLGPSTSARHALIYDGSQAAARHEQLGGVASILIAPVRPSGRFMGAIELGRAPSAPPFRADDGNALWYIAEQYSEFINTKGVVFDPKRIARGARPGR